MFGKEVVQRHRQAILNGRPVVDVHGDLPELDFDGGIVIAGQVDLAFAAWVEVTARLCISDGVGTGAGAESPRPCGP